LTNPGKIISSVKKTVGIIYKIIAVIIRILPVAPVVTTNWLVQVELIATAVINNGLRWVIDEVVVVYFIEVAIIELDTRLIVVDCVFN